MVIEWQMYLPVWYLDVNLYYQRQEVHALYESPFISTGAERMPAVKTI